MSSIADSSVIIQTSAQSVPSTPSWLGEVTLIAHFLRCQGVLSSIEEQVRFARRRFGHYEVIDFVAVLIGYAISSEHTLEAFYERVLPFATAFMALFGRNHLPVRSTLSRFLAALDQAPVEALRELFLKDLLARPQGRSEKTGGLWDRQGAYWLETCALPICNRHCLRLSVASTRSALQAIWGASVAKSSARALPFFRCIRISGSARFPAQAMAITGASCSVQERRSVPI